MKDVGEFLKKCLGHQGDIEMTARHLQDIYRTSTGHLDLLFKTFEALLPSLVRACVAAVLTLCLNKHVLN